MRLLIITICLTVTTSYSWAQSAQVEANSSASLGGSQESVSVSGSASASERIDSLLQPLRSYLGEPGHKALSEALQSVPLPVLNQISSAGQLFGTLATFNPSVLPSLATTIFPGATSTISSYLPTVQSAGLGLLRSLVVSGALNSSPLTSFFRQNFPANVGASGSADGSHDSSRGLDAYNPANIANGLMGQGMANFAGIANSLASGQPLSALLSMAGGAGDAANRLGNLAANGLNMASSAAQAATGLASRIPGPMGQISGTLSSMMPGSSPSSSFGASASASAGPGRLSGRGSASGSSSLGNLMANSPFTSFLGRQ